MTTSAKRLDSAARRAQLLDVADRVFTAHGVHAPLDLIVEMAGVGRATLYRQFPDRHMLLLALMERSAQWLATRARRLAHRDDAFFRLLDYMASRIVRSPALSDYWRTTRMSDPRFSDVYQEVLNAFAPWRAHNAQGCCMPTCARTTSPCSPACWQPGCAARPMQSVANLWDAHCASCSAD